MLLRSPLLLPPMHRIAFPFDLTKDGSELQFPIAAPRPVALLYQMLLQEQMRLDA